MSPLALFDLDNTLVDRKTAFRRWATRFVVDRSLGDGALEYLIEADGDGFATRQAVFDAMRARYGLVDTTADLIEGYRASYLDFFEPDPSVGTALRSLRSRGWRVGVVTNGPPTQREKLERAGLLELLDGVCISDELGVAKPDRRIFEEALRRCGEPGSPPADSWMVGDTAIPDIAGGHGAGMRTIWMHRGRSWDLYEFRPDRSVGSIAEAVAWMVAEEEVEGSVR